MNAYRVVGAVGGAALAVLAVLVAIDGCSRPRYSPVVLEEAIRRGDEAEVRKCLAHGVGPNCRFHPSKPTLRYTPLQVAAEEGQLRIVELLVQAGADINAADGRGQTPLIAVVGGDRDRLECFKYLLKAGADPAKGDTQGYTALMDAAWHGETEYVELLISAGVDVNQEADGGTSALHVVCNPLWPGPGHVATLKILLDAGADATKRDKYGGTPIDWARRANRVELLREFAARGLIPKDSIPEEKPK